MSTHLFSMKHKIIGECFLPPVLNSFLYFWPRNPRRVFWSLLGVLQIPDPDIWFSDPDYIFFLIQDSQDVFDAKWVWSRFNDSSARCFSAKREAIWYFINTRTKWHYQRKECVKELVNWWIWTICAINLSVCRARMLWKKNIFCSIYTNERETPCTL